jgi:hypothetical protein
MGFVFCFSLFYQGRKNPGNISVAAVLKRRAEARHPLTAIRSALWAQESLHSLRSFNGLQVGARVHRLCGPEGQG